MVYLGSEHAAAVHAAVLFAVHAKWLISWTESGARGVCVVDHLKDAQRRDGRFACDSPSVVAMKARKGRHYVLVSFAGRA